MIGPLGVGDICAVEVTGFAGWAITLGSALRGEPTPATHVVCVHHQDKAGRWWGIQGQPGGVGWVDMAQYWGSPTARFGNSNSLQPRTPQQRAAIAQVLEGLLHTGYDWVGGIVPDGFDDLHQQEVADLIDRLWGSAGKTAPGHLVCSAVASYTYRRLSLPAPPGQTEQVQPGDWWRWNATQGWAAQ